MIQYSLPEDSSSPQPQRLKSQLLQLSKNQVGAWAYMDIHCITEHQTDHFDGVKLPLSFEVLARL